MKRIKWRKINIAKGVARDDDFERNYQNKKTTSVRRRNDMITTGRLYVLL